MPPSLRVGLRAPVLAMLLGGLLTCTAHAQSQTEPVRPVADAAPAKRAPAPVTNSALDAELFYQLFIAELELRRGETGTAYQITLEAARRHRSEDLFRRSVDIAVGARQAEQAVAAAKQWRQSLPRSRAAAEMQSQLLIALGRPAEGQDALRAMVELTPAAERNGIIGALPRLVLVHEGNPAQARATATVIDEVLRPWREQPATRTSALAATGRAWLAAGDTQRALDLMQQAQRIDPGHEQTALLALDLIATSPAPAEQAVRTYLQTQPNGVAVRLGYSRRLATAHEYQKALQVVREVTERAPDNTAAWLMQGALQVELLQWSEARTSLERFVTLRQPAAKPTTATQDDSADEDDNDDIDPQLQRDLSQAYLMLAQVCEQLKDYPAAQRWLDQLGDQASTAQMVQRRASLLARQGKLAEGRALLQKLPERTPDELRTKTLSEAQLLRDAREWQAAYAVLEQASRRLPDDADLGYEQALLAERLQRFDDMERLLRRVIELKPDQQHAYNALGYSLADRNERLPEARQLIVKALEMTPDDPFIMDSLGWVEFRLGNDTKALELLRNAYGKRPDTEIGAHLGEVLWRLHQRDEALQIWRAARERDPDNEMLRDTLKRLGVSL